MSTKIPIVRKRNKKNGRTKSILMFDENARLEYLTGFRKRKKERQKKAKEQIAQEIKEERKQIKKQHREMMLKHIREQRSIPDLPPVEDSTVHELPNHTVTVTEIDHSDFRDDGGVMLGFNQFEDEKDKEEGEDTAAKDSTTKKPSVMSTDKNSKLKNMLKEKPKSHKPKHKSYNQKPRNKFKGPTTKSERRKRKGNRN